MAQPEIAELVHVVCPSCETPNRMPREKLRAGGRCGKCHKPLFLGKPVALDAKSLEHHLRASDIPLLVDFWAPWCGPCQAMAPALEQAAASLEPEVRLAKINIDEAQALASQLGIQSIPTLALFRGGREVARRAGAMNATAITGWARQNLR
jgi:thioredoxin 2